MQYVRHYSEAAKRFGEVINMGTMGCKQLSRQTLEDKGALEQAGKGGEHDENYTSILFSCLLFPCDCHSRHCACVRICECVRVKGVATHRELKAHKQTLHESAACGGCRAE